MNNTITIINLNANHYDKQPVPEVGKEYNIFDDGKINPIRHSTATILEVIPFDKCEDAGLIESWVIDVSAYDWVYATETDYFIKADSPKDNPMWFVRTTDGGWFSLGFWASRLDIDGSLYKSMIEHYEKEVR